MDRISNELLIRIGQHTQDGATPHVSLYSMILCCRRFHQVLQPVLHSHVSLQDFSPRSLGFIMRVWRDPTLARQIHRLDLCWSDCEGDELTLDEDPDRDRDLETAFTAAALDEIFSPEEQAKRELWEEHLHGDSLCAEAWSALLLVRLRHLRVLEFGHEGRSELMSDLLSKAARRERPFHAGPHPFAALRDVRACVCWTGSWIASDFLMPFFYFPAVRTMTGIAVREVDDGDDLTDLRRSSPCPVREISFDTVYDCRGLRAWLAACTHLTHLSFALDLSRSQLSVPEDRRFSIPRLRAALLPFTSTLKTLQVRYKSGYKSFVVDPSAGFEDSFGSFREFVALENLSVRHDHLINLADLARHRPPAPLAEMLPASLVSLDITDVVAGLHRELLADLDQFLRQRHTFPRFGRLMLGTREKDHEQVCHDCKEVMQLCRDVNVSMTIKVDEYD